MAEIIELGPAKTAMMFGLILMVASVSWIAKLDLAYVILNAALRCLVQLMVLGLVLQQIFDIGHPALVVLYLLLITALAAREGFARAKVYYDGLGLNIFVSFLILISTLGVSFAICLVLRPEPLLTPRYVIPVCGMLLGNGLTGLALTIDLFMSHLEEKREHIEVLLAYGASPWRALLPGVRSSLRRGMIPTLNQMTVAGLVSIPGMMTGQVLGGTSPAQAALYQVFIFYLISSSTFLASTLVVFLTIRSLVDRRGRLRYGKLKKDKRANIADLMNRPVQMVIKLIKEGTQTNKNEKTGFPPCARGVSETKKLAASLARPRILRAAADTHPSLLLASEDAILSLRADSLSREGSRGQILLHDLQVDVHAGHAVCILGPSGSGKSTLLRVLSDLVSCEGNMLLRGRELESFEPLDWRRQVRYCAVPKAPMTGTPKQFVEDLGPLGFLDLASAVEKQLEEWEMDTHLLDAEWAHLSTGEVQRIWLSIGLASKPAVLLLDEPTSALDEISKQRVETTVLRFIHEGGAAVVVTHDRAQGQRLGNIWEMQDVREETVELIVNDPGQCVHDFHCAASEERTHDTNMSDSFNRKPTLVKHMVARLLCGWWQISKFSAQ